MAYGTADGTGALRRERLRNARLYFVCEARPGGEDPEPLLRAALDGGVDMIQLREKSGDTRMIDRAAPTFRRLADTYGVPFMINDDPELAVIHRADGVHIGQDDMTVEEARRIVGADALIGLSTHSEEQIQAAEGVDHISVGPVWETPTKAGPTGGRRLTWSASPPGPRPSLSLRSAASTPATWSKYLKPEPAGSAWCARSATHRTRRRWRPICGGHSLR